MAGITFSTADKVLKEDYKDLIEQLNQEFFILTQIERNQDSVEGKRAYHALHVTRSSGVGSRGENGTLPGAGNQGYTAAYIPIRFHYGRIQVSGPAIKAMARDSAAFVRAVDSEMQGVTADLKRELNRQIWGTSDGVIATCGTTTTSNTVQLIATTTATQMLQLWSDGGMVVDIGTVASPTTVATARAVTGYDPTNLTITIGGATVSTTSGTHKVFRTGNGGASSGTNLVGDGQFELTGLQSIVASSGVLHGVDPSTYPVWKSTVDANGGTNRSVSESLINKNIQAGEIASGDPIDLLVCNAGVHRAIANDMRAMRRNIDNVDLKAGYSGIAWSVAGEMDRGSAKKVIKIERDCPSNQLFLLSTKGLVSYEMSSDFEWMEADGAILSRVVGTDGYEATLFKYFELAARRRNSHSLIKDLTEA